MADSPDSGIFVVESPAGEEPIPLRHETVTAFVGPAPRGPAHIPISVASVEEFRKRFGSPAERSRMEWVLSQYFDNGGEIAIVVRVPRSGARNRILLPGPGGTLDLVAQNPGPFEFLRAAVDYDGIPVEDLWRFNLTVQRIRSPSAPLVEEQEIYRSVSVDPDDSAYVGDSLAESMLVRLLGEPPRARPNVTSGGGAAAGGYVICNGDWRSSAPPTDYDLIGSERESTGFFALDQVAAIDLVCLLSGAADVDVGPVALFAAERYCRRRNAMLLLDPPSYWTSTADVVRSQRERGFASPNVLTYFPLLRETSADGRRSHQLTALGGIAGLLARLDREAASGDVPRVAEPTGMLRSRARVATEIDTAEAAALVRSGVNALLPAAPGFVGFAGHVTLARQGGSQREWLHLGSRRRALALLATIARSTRWAAMQAAGPDTWKNVAAQVTDYLAGLRSAGVLAGNAPREAFYVKCDQDTNRGPGLSFVVGIALTRPSEFIAFRFDHDVTDCSITELGWQPGLALAG